MPLVAVVARDFAQCECSPTSSVRPPALAGSRRQNIVGLDVSMAFLFAEWMRARKSVRSSCGQSSRQGWMPFFLRIKKALYGFLAAQAWARHLAKLLKRLCDLDPLRPNHVFLLVVSWEVSVWQSSATSTTSL